MSDPGVLGGLPRRDLWLLPLIAFATALAMLVAAEIAAEIAWPEQKLNSCAGPDPVLGSRFRPHCTSVMKGAEGPWYTNTYNECGYRSTASCGVPPPGTRRIAMVGSSMGEGYLVPYADTVGVRATASLARLCPFPVELQNLAARGYTGQRIVLRMQEAMRLHPVQVLYLITPYDIETQLDPATLPLTGSDAAPSAATPAAAPPPAPMLAGRLAILAREARAVTVAQSLLVRDPATFLALFLHYGDKADFLRPPFTPAWRERLRRFDLLIARLAALAQAGGARFTLGFVPQQAELALAARPASGLDPAALPRALAAIAAAHGADFFDATPALVAEPDPERLYYPVDGHPSALGQPVIGAALARHLGGTGPFAACQMREAARAAP